jgi:DNA-binding Lrp family transcriptional regulator
VNGRGCSTLGSYQSPLVNIKTPYDSLIPAVDEPSAQFYLDIIKTYLALFSGAISIEEALLLVDKIKENPEFVKYPTDPTLLPLNDHFKDKFLDNLKTLTKFNLLNADSIRSAYSFALLPQDVVLGSVDFDVLCYITKHARSSFSTVAEELDMAPRTVSRAIERLHEKISLRFNCYVDNTAFGAETVTVFFTPMKQLDWNEILESLIMFPFTKTLLKTSMTDLGYISVMIPGGQSSVKAFIKSFKALEGIVFEYVSAHVQTSMGSSYNLGLYDGEKWGFPEDVWSYVENVNFPSTSALPPLLQCRGYLKGLSPVEFVVASELKIDYKRSPRMLASILANQGMDADQRRIAQIIRRLHDRGLILPYVFFEGLGLSSNFCFEVVCNDNNVKRVLSFVSLIPAATYMTSDRGIIVWIRVPGSHQVDYYRLFRSLESLPGVESVLSVMTISAKGSRSMGDLIKTWTYGRQGWTVPVEALDIASYVQIGED